MQAFAVQIEYTNRRSHEDMFRWFEGVKMKQSNDIIMFACNCAAV